MKDHEIAQAVDAMTDIARVYGKLPQLRDRLGERLVPLLRRIPEATALTGAPDVTLSASGERLLALAEAYASAAAQSAHFGTPAAAKARATAQAALRSGIDALLTQAGPDVGASADALDQLIATTTAWLAEVEFQDYTFIVRASHGGVVLQARYVEPDTYTGKPETQFTRKWLISPHMTKSEVISTAFKCCLTSMEHRAREAFRYSHRRIFGPHFDVDDLRSLCLDRENAGGRLAPELVVRDAP